MIFTYSIILVLTLALSFWRLRYSLHPQILVTAMTAYMIPLDFIIRGEDDESIASIVSSIDPALLGWYQLGMLFVYVSIWGASFAHSVKHDAKDGLNRELTWATVTSSQMTVFSLVATLIVTLEILKRLSFSDWSIVTMINISFGPRGSAAWNYAQGNIGDGNFVYQIIIQLVPLSGMIYAYLSVVGTSIARPLWLAAFAVVVMILIADGSRTPVFLVVMCLIVCIWKLSKLPSSFKLGFSVFLIFLLMAIAVVMYQFRSQGFQSLFSDTGTISWTLYHQDDSYYRALNAMEVSTTSVERWDPFQFFYVVVTNPIPRYFWAGKPLLLADYWGNYKLEYVTIAFIGELVAMFGVIGGLVFSLATGWLIYLLIRRASKLLTDPGGIIIYFLVVLYGYMLFRSLLNITQFLYLPLFAYSILWFNKERLNFWAETDKQGRMRVQNR